MTRPDHSASEQTAAEVQEIANSLSDGDEVLIDDRSRPLTVTGRHKRAREKVYHYHADDHYKIVELEGNNTSYHLLWTHGSDSKPMLYKRSEWDIEEDWTGEERPQYNRSGTRISSIGVVPAEK
jgi:hypothetical protein